MASTRISDADGVGAQGSAVGQMKTSEGKWWSWWSPSPESFQFRLPHGDIPVPRKNVQGVLQETMYTFDVLDEDIVNDKVVFTTGNMVRGRFRRERHHPVDEQRVVTGRFKWQSFHQKKHDRNLFGGPHNNIKWSLAEKWESDGCTNMTKSTIERPSVKRQNEHTRSAREWVFGKILRLMGKQKLMEWWDWISGDEHQRWIGAMLFYLMLTDLGQQIVHVGLDENLVKEGRDFAEENNGKPGRAMEDRAHEMWDQPSMFWPDFSGEKLAGVTCLHFEPPGTAIDSVATFTHERGGRVHLPLRKKLFLYSGHSTLWPERRLGTLSGVAFLDSKTSVVYKGGRKWRKMFMFVSIGRYADMPPSMFMEAKFEPKPAFYVGTYDNKDPTHRGDNTDLRTNPVNPSGFVDYFKVKLLPTMASEILKLWPATRAIGIDDVCDLDTNMTDNSTLLAQESVSRRFANLRAEGNSPKEITDKGNMTEDHIVSMMYYLQLSFRCSSSYLRVPEPDYQV
eukprot:TRINITY_DN25766_c0_g1_i4.p1 TRINITY_DN25766_c0_g1~~TRINITY_DN25766_c0_g1_i4.p1  ORF type:complete len:508 (+),score=39.32 TRINITY_DN25766_c0_g1_i4:278-1801(+)